MMKKWRNLKKTCADVCNNNLTFLVFLDLYLYFEMSGDEQQIGIDVTGLSERQLKQVEDAKEMEGFVQGGIMFPSEFKNMQSPDEKVIKLKNTKRNKEIWSKYEQKGFLKDGSFNYKSWSDLDLIKEISHRKDDGKKKTRTNFLRLLGQNRLIKLKEKLAMARNREETKTAIATSINRFLERGTPEAEAKYKRKLAKKRIERAQINKTKKAKKIEKEKQDILLDAQ